jgi:hypothetical protein
VFVYVVVVLEVPVAIVDVVDVIVVHNFLAIIVLGVRRPVIRVDPGLRMTIPAVDVVDVIAVHHRLVSVTREVFVVGGFGVLVGCHRYSSAPGPYGTGDSGDSKHNDNHCQ